MHCIIGQQCLNGFIESLPNGGRRNNGQQRVIPDINFTCNGSITGWTITARWRTDGNRALFPFLLVLRSAGGDNYTVEGSTELFVPDDGRASGQNYIFNGTTDPPVEFQAGDVFGFFQPRGGRSRVHLSYERDTGPISYYVSTNSLLDSLTITDSNVENDTDLPAIILQISKCNHAVARTLYNS